MALFDVTDWLFVNILFTKADKILIKNLFELKDYNAKHLVREFPSTGWNVGTGQCLQVRFISENAKRSCDPDPLRRHESR